MANNMIVIILSVFIVVLLYRLIEIKNLKTGERITYYILLVVFFILLSVRSSYFWIMRTVLPSQKVTYFHLFWDNGTVPL